MGIKVSIMDLVQASSHRDLIESPSLGELAMILDKSLDLSEYLVSLT